MTVEPPITGPGPQAVTVEPPITGPGQQAVTVEPPVSELGIDPGTLSWRRSGTGDGAIEIAFARDRVLMRVVGDPAGRVLVFDRHEWECFLDGARNGEFDDSAAP